MICKECGAFFIRFPCPSCGQTESQVFEEEELALLRKIKSTVLSDSSLEPPENLMKPSELDGKTKYLKEREPEKETDPSLLKPSQLNPDRMVDPSNPFDNDEEESLVKPSALKGGSSVNPKFSVQNKTDTKLRTNFEVQKTHERLENETDDEYRKRVKNTLQDVMKLLDKLIKD